MFLAVIIFLLFSACGAHKKVVERKAPYKSFGNGKIATEEPYVVNGKTYYPLQSSHGYQEIGVASWYGREFHNRPTASGETFNMHTVSAAHATLPIGSIVTVRNLENGRSIKVRINDRGPFVENRVIDLSYEAARELGFASKGTAKVLVIAERYEEKSYEPYDRFFVQVGTFKYLENAKTALRIFSGIVNPMQIVYDVQSEAYKVKAGAFSSKEEAQKARTKIVDKGFVDSFVEMGFK